MDIIRNHNRSQPHGRCRHCRGPLINAAERRHQRCAPCAWYRQAKDNCDSLNSYCGLIRGAQMNIWESAARELAQYSPGSREYHSLLAAFGSPAPVAIIDMATNLRAMNGGRPLGEIKIEFESGIESTGELLQAIYDFLARFVAYPSEYARIAHTLWIMHAHTVAAAESTPRLAFLSPEPGSGRHGPWKSPKPLYRVPWRL